MWCWCVVRIYYLFMFSYQSRTRTNNRNTEWLKCIPRALHQHHPSHRSVSDTCWCTQTDTQKRVRVCLYSLHTHTDRRVCHHCHHFELESLPAAKHTHGQNISALISRALNVFLDPFTRRADFNDHTHTRSGTDFITKYVYWLLVQGKSCATPSPPPIVWCFCVRDASAFPIKTLIKYMWHRTSINTSTTHISRTHLYSKKGGGGVL